MSSWFERLVGFREESPSDVREKLQLDAARLASTINGKSFDCGRLEVVPLQELRTRAAEHRTQGGRLQIEELIADARALHADEANAGALFQVASQFNLLEMVSPEVTPERGVGIYENDPTQGPACAIACGAGTIYRNYFVELDGQSGQTASRQIDCLSEIGKSLGNVGNRLWEMKNGYALPSAKGLEQVDASLASLSESEIDNLRGKLRIGMQWDAQVTVDDCAHFVTQAYCSAMPVSYSGLPSRLWWRFAQLILDAAYEATLAAAVLNSAKTGNNSVYLTLLGGGAFGNKQAWILDAIKRACLMFKDHALDVKIVSYRTSRLAVQRSINEITKQIETAAKTNKASASSHDNLNHFCPGCGMAQKPFLRYPWYFCKECLKLATDGNGQRLEFGNVSLSGGLYWKYAGAEHVDAAECGTVVCLIHGRPVIVTEARFGGVVAQPLGSHTTPSGHRVVDLRSRSS